MAGHVGNCILPKNTLPPFISQLLDIIKTTISIFHVPYPAHPEKCADLSILRIKLMPRQLFITFNPLIGEPVSD